MIFGYARVSTKTQARDGNSLDAQQAALTAAGAEKIYTDTFTGTKMDRPEWDRLRAQLWRGDVLIVTRLDRLARSVSQASGMITEMIDDPGEYNDFMNRVQENHGFKETFQDKVEEAKN